MLKALFVGIPLIGTMVAAPTEWSVNQDKDLAAVLRVVKKSEEIVKQSEKSREVKSIRIHIWDRDDGETLKLSLPFSLFEWVAELAEDSKLSDLDDLDIDSDIRLTDLLKALKSLGPSELIEIDGDDGTIRIWLE